MYVVVPVMLAAVTVATAAQVMVQLLTAKLALAVLTVAVQLPVTIRVTINT